MNPTTLFIEGKIICDIECMEWTPHPKFKGVYLKNLLTGKETGGKISAHIMKIDPHTHVPEHIHEGMAEIHEVLEGDGLITINGIDTDYSAGVISYVPDDTPHEVQTREKSLLYFAKFIPALI